MGIDVYLNWDGQNDEEKRAQYTGYRTDAGNVGYLREAYHGGPYATRVLIPEGWDDAVEDDPQLPAAVLRERLPATVMTAIYRHYSIYEQGVDPSVIKGDDDGDLITAIKDIFLSKLSNGDEADIAKSFNDEQLRQTSALIAQRGLPAYALAFVDFVLLAERKEAQTGKPCRVHVSA